MELSKEIRQNNCFYRSIKWRILYMTLVKTKQMIYFGTSFRSAYDTCVQKTNHAWKAGVCVFSVAFTTSRPTLQTFITITLKAPISQQRVHRYAFSFAYVSKQRLGKWLAVVTSFLGKRWDGFMYFYSVHTMLWHRCLLGLTQKTDVLIFCSSFYENKRQVVFVLSCGLATRFNTSWIPIVC